MVLFLERRLFCFCLAVLVPFQVPVLAIETDSSVEKDDAVLDRDCPETSRKSNDSETPGVCQENLSYGVDVSFPMHHESFSMASPIGDSQQIVYADFMNGCRNTLPQGDDLCEMNEKGRIELNIAQPASLQNFTDTGYKKVRAPPEMFKALKAFYDANIGAEIEEDFTMGDIYMNHWVAPSYVLDVADYKLEGGGPEVMDQFHQAVRPTLEEWSGQELDATYGYGVRIYTEGAILSPHVDGARRVTSAIVNVAQDCDEAWPLEVIDLQGKAHNITMEPGDMVLYESRTVIHGRPYPLRGRFFANVFFHFEPVGFERDYDEEEAESRATARLQRQKLWEDEWEEDDEEWEEDDDEWSGDDEEWEDEWSGDDEDWEEEWEGEWAREEEEMEDENAPSYGVDVSFPMHHPSITEENNPLGDSQKIFYEDFMNGCREAYPDVAHLCDTYEKDRIAVNMEQPARLQNYTSTGYKKLRAPKELWDTIKEFWDNNHGLEYEEGWPRAETSINHWDAPSYVIDIGDGELQGGGALGMRKIHEAAQPTLEDWSGQELVYTNMYGVRSYTEGSILTPHVDGARRVISAIVNVAQDCDEPWPLEVIDLQGKARNVTMDVGDMVLYESRTVIHGRPYPLRGRFFANLFIHFEPVGYDRDYDEEQAEDAFDEEYEPRRLREEDEEGEEWDEDEDEWDEEGEEWDEEDSEDMEEHMDSKDGFDETHDGAKKKKKNVFKKIWKILKPKMKR